jgi:hypoxanthine phosphoribosyltransferase
MDMHRQYISEDEIRDRVTAIARQIDEDHAGTSLDVVCLLGGGSVFCADLLRLLTVPTRSHPFGFMSYPKGSPSGEVRITLDVGEPLHGRHVLVVEGIVVSGRTPRYVLDMLRVRKPASLKLCALGIKPHALAADLEIAYRAFEFGDEIVVGYGVGEGHEKALPYLASRAKESV